MTPHRILGHGGPAEILTIFDRHGERAHLLTLLTPSALWWRTTASQVLLALQPPEAQPTREDRRPNVARRTGTPPPRPRPFEAGGHEAADERRLDRPRAAGASGRHWAGGGPHEVHGALTVASERIVAEREHAETKATGGSRGSSSRAADEGDDLGRAAPTSQTPSPAPAARHRADRPAGEDANG